MQVLLHIIAFCAYTALAAATALHAPGLAAPWLPAAWLPELGPLEAGGLGLAVSQAQRVRDEGWSGLYLMSPASPAAVPEVLRGLRG